MVVGCERAGLVAAVEGKDAEAVFVVVEKVYRLATEVGGVEAAPHGVVIEAGIAHADVVAHNVGVGAGIPAEEDMSVLVVDGAKTQRARRCGHIVLIEKADGQRGVGGGGDEVVDRVEADGAVEGIEVDGVGEGGDAGVLLLVGEQAEEAVGGGVVQSVPTEHSHLISDHGGLDKPKRLRRQ